MLFLLIVSFLFCGVLSTDKDLKETIELMKQEIQALKSARLMYNERLGELETQIRQGKTNFEMLSKLNNKRAKDQETPIAFSARFSHDLGYLTDNHIFVFDDVATNVGNRYDSKTGIFHCDEAGLYVFQLSMVAVPGSYVTAQIAKNHQGEAWAFAMDPTNSSSGGTMVVLYLQPGDAVYARVNGRDHDYKSRSITKLYTSFSGFLIR